jgi:hypothetical protein
MSRGIGAMQRRILPALAARQGGDRIRNTADYGFTLATGIHDMRQVCKEVARTHGGISHCSFVSESWSASFTRVLTSLARLGYIEVPPLVPVAADELGIATQLSDGLYLPNANHSQHRFVWHSMQFSSLYLLPCPWIARLVHPAGAWSTASGHRCRTSCRSS